MAGKEKPACLIVCSSDAKGVSAQSFIHAFTLTSSTFNVYLATPEGRPMEFVDVDDNNKQWVNDFSSKQISVPHRLENMESSKFIAMVIPSCPGAPFDLASNNNLAVMLKSFIEQKKPLCAVGFGVCGLFSTAAAPAAAVGRQASQWNFSRYSLTAPSTIELAQRQDFATLPVVPADFIRKHGATYSASKSESTYVVVDTHLVTGQNSQSTLTSVQNLILLSNARLTRQK